VRCHGFLLTLASFLKEAKSRHSVTTVTPACDFPPDNLGSSERQFRVLSFPFSRIRTDFSKLGNRTWKFVAWGSRGKRTRFNRGRAL
jgi:hypothetical protein